MIYTITFAPSLDYEMRLKSFQEGMVNRSALEHVRLGGKGINVAVVSAALGRAACALGFVGGFVGDEIVRRAVLCGVQEQFVRVASCSRINPKLFTEGAPVTEINGSGGIVTADEGERLLKQIEQIKDGDTVVVSGSVPLSIPDLLYPKILAGLKTKKVRVAVDTSGKALKRALKIKPFLIKPNLTELCEAVGKNLTTHSEIFDGARALQTAGAQNVMVSLGADGAVLLTQDGAKFFAAAPKGKARNTVGAGDSALAGFLRGVENGWSAALQLAVACGSATAFSDQLATAEAAEAIKSQVVVTEE